MAPKPTTVSGKVAGNTRNGGKKGEQRREPARAKSKKSPPSDVDRLKRLFTSLCAQVDGGHFANAVKTCDKILRIAPRDPDALQTKLFLLLQTEQYEPALDLINSLKESASDAIALNFEFEKAYALYRLHRAADATAVLHAIKQSEATLEEQHRGVIHLEAQLAYREGEYQSAFDLYNTLLDTAEPHSDEQADILTNLSAAQAHLDFLTSGFLTSLAALTPALTDRLESAPPPPPPSSLSPSFTSLATAPRLPLQDTQPVIQTVPQPKRPRARRLPKGVIPGVTPQPDPERWVKKSERSGYMQHGRRKGRSGGGGGGGATQGIVETPGAGAGAQGGAGAGGAKGKKKGRK